MTRSQIRPQGNLDANGAVIVAIDSEGVVSKADRLWSMAMCTSAAILAFFAPELGYTE